MRGNWAACRKRNFFGVVKGFRVEPVAFLNFIALGIFHLVSHIGTYQVICYHTIGDNPNFDCATVARGGGHGHGHGHGGGGHAGGHRGHGNASFANDTAVLNTPLSPPLEPVDDVDFPDSTLSDQWDETRVTNATHPRSRRAGDTGGRRHGNSSFADLPRASGRNSSRRRSGYSRSAHQALETQLQKAAVWWHMIFQLCHALPALFTDTLLGALGDRHGRQANILIGLSGTIVSVYAMTIMFTFKRAPLFILIISNLISGFTGYMSIIMISCYAYLADTVVDHELLTVRMTYFSLIMSLSGIISPQIGGALMGVLSNAWVSSVAQALLVCSFLLTLLIVHQRPPVLMRKKMLEKYIKENGHPPPAGNEKFEKYHTKTEPDGDRKGESVQKEENAETGRVSSAAERKSGSSELASIWKSFLQLWKEVYITYTRPRPGHARLYLLFTSFVYFLHITFEGGIRMSVFSLYVLKAPFHWGPTELSTYRSVNSALHLVGSMVGVAIFKKFFKFSDTTIILIAMGTHTVESVLFGLARSTAGLYVAAAVGSMTLLMAPCVKSFISQLVNPDEVGKSFTAFSIATTVAHISSNVIYSNIYGATVGWYDGFAFMVAAGLELICMALISWLHFDYHYDSSFAKWAKTNPCARLIRRKPVAEANQSPAPAAFSMKDQTPDAAKSETTRAASEKF